jgi:hypothetical protein
MRSFFAALALIASSGCASAPPANTETGARTQRRADVIAEDELRRSDAVNVLEAIRQLRPRFLQQRGDASINARSGMQVVVYIDDMRAGQLEVLESLHPTEVREIRHLDGPQASARFGLNHGGGAILVYRRLPERRS